MELSTNIYTNFYRHIKSENYPDKPRETMDKEIDELLTKQGKTEETLKATGQVEQS